MYLVVYIVNKMIRGSGGHVRGLSLRTASLFIALLSAALLTVAQDCSVASNSRSFPFVVSVRL